MDYLIAIIYGAVQGLGEFLPISSSGHLVLLHKLLPVPFSNDLAFDVTLHLGTLVAVLWFFKQDIIDLIKSWFGSFKNLPAGLNDLSWLVLLATIPAAVIGKLFGDKVETAFGQPVYVALMLALVGVLFLVAEKFAKQEQELSAFRPGKALLIGCAQALALFPGTSRSGITIIAALGLGLKREAAVRFSFLLSIPIITGAAVLKVPELLRAQMNQHEWLFLGLAFISAAISGFWAIGYMLKFIKASDLKPFAYYRIALAIIVLAIIAFA
jgi:undecaprenyl-diphosphatase